MFDNFFTVYGLIEPPKVYKDNPLLLAKNIKDISFNNYAFEGDIPDFRTTDTIEDYPGVTKPSERLPALSLTTLLETSTKTVDSNHLRGLDHFEEAFKEACKIDPQVKLYKDFLARIAKKESNFNSFIQNTAGAPYYGYFQMGKNEIKQATGLSVEEFRNNPVILIIGAVKLYQTYLKTMKALGIYSLGKEKGYSDDALVAGAWLGGPGGVKKYLKGLGDPSDSHWYKNGKGETSVGRRMKEFNS